MPGRVERIWTAEYDSAPMQARERVEAVRGGILGDRYCTGRGYYSPFDVCEVTLIEAEVLEEIRDEVDIDLTDGRHRRNVVVRAASVHDLLRKQFTIGDARFEGTRPRPPCAHVEEVAGEEGVARALRGKRGGICADVLDPGEFGVGDELRVARQDPRTLGRNIADRLRDEG